MCPAHPLHDEAREGLGRKSGDHRAVDIGASVTPRVKLERGLGIFGDCLTLDASDLHDVLAPEQGRRAAEEGSVQPVQPALDDRIEHLVLARHLAERVQVALKRVRIEEEVRGLDEEEFRVLDEVADRAGQDVRRRNVVGVQDEDQFPVRILERGVDIAGLRVIVLFAGQVVRAEAGADFLQVVMTRLGFGGLLRVGLGALTERAAIIKQIDLHAAGRVVHIEGRGQRDFEKIVGLIIAGDQDVDGRASGRRHRRRARRALVDIHRQEGRQKQQDVAVGLRAEKKYSAHDRQD